MVRKMTTEDLIETIHLTRRYASYRILKLWGIALITIPLINILVMILFEVWIAFGRNSEIIYAVLQGVAIVVITIFFTRAFLSIKKLEIKEKEIVSSYYIKLGFALLGVFIFFAVLFMIAELIEGFVGPVPTPYRQFPFVLGGYLSEINGVRTLVYWGDNLALLIGYILLRNKKTGVKLVELPFAIAFLTIFDILSVTLDPYVFKTEFLGDNFLYVSGFFAISSGIIALIRAYKNLKKRDILVTKETQ